MVAHVKFSQRERGECWRIKKMEFWAMRTVACVVSSVEPSFLQANFRVFVQISRTVQEAESYFPFQSRRRSSMQCLKGVAVNVWCNEGWLPVRRILSSLLLGQSQCSVLMKHFSRFNIMIDRSWSTSSTPESWSKFKKHLQHNINYQRILLILWMSNELRIRHLVVLQPI